ncbi:hypothetical protein [Nocardia alba]|uniref:PPE family protein n=1 Tax=Nocardia alba TaxID=225051 RepID=A0A4R1FZ13_9NOCA|nr:hypothetical protein [Nocardia alba]TCK00478.1 hypothetical protein DFR71_1478 [Nocardia alba]
MGGLKNLVTSPFSDDDELESSEIADIQNKYNTQRDDNRKKAGDLGFDGEYRPTVVTKNNLFPGTVQELRAKVDKIDLDAVAALIAAWNEISTRNSTSLDEFRKQIARGMSPDVWSGSAANAAAQTVAAYDATGKKVTTAAALTSTKLDELRTGLEPTKRLVPHEPEHRSGLDNVGALLTGRGWRNDDVAQENARVEAVRILQTVYAPVIYESDNKVPVIPIPTTVENGGGQPETKLSTTQSTTQGSTTQPTTQSTTTQPTTPASTNPTTDPDDTDSADTDDSTTPESTTPQSTEPGSTTPASTTPSATVPGSGSPSGSPSGAGSPGGGSPGAGTPGAGTPGGAVAASPTAAGAAGGRGTGAGTTGRAGTPGMMSPGAGKGGGKDDESTKAIPDYLITQENGDELTGLDTLPKMVPPVIGAD